jgi:hypothetical protein
MGDWHVREPKYPPIGCSSTFYFGRDTNEAQLPHPSLLKYLGIGDGAHSSCIADGEMLPNVTLTVSLLAAYQGEGRIFYSAQGASIVSQLSSSPRSKRLLSRIFKSKNTAPLGPYPKK